MMDNLLVSNSIMSVLPHLKLCHPVSLGLTCATVLMMIQLRPGTMGLAMSSVAEQTMIQLRPGMMGLALSSVAEQTSFQLRPGTMGLAMSSVAEQTVAPMVRLTLACMLIEACRRRSSSNKHVG